MAKVRGIRVFVGAVGWLARLEIDMWRSLFLWLARRRPGLQPGVTAYPYVAIVRPALWAFIVGSAIEVLAVHLLLQRWPAVQLPALVLGIWGLLWMLGMLGGVTAYPHLVGPDGVRLRSGGGAEVTLAWSDIVAAKAVRHDYEGIRRIRCDGDWLALLQLGQTNVEIQLQTTLTPALARGRTGVSSIRVYADDARALVSALRAGMGASPRVTP
jgi:hypothetical protein